MRWAPDFVRFSLGGVRQLLTRNFITLKTPTTLLREARFVGLVNLSLSPTTPRRKSALRLRSRAAIAATLGGVRVADPLCAPLAASPSPVGIFPC